MLSISNDKQNIFNNKNTLESVERVGHVASKTIQMFHILDFGTLFIILKYKYVKKEWEFKLRNKKHSFTIYID